MLKYNQSYHIPTTYIFNTRVFNPSLLIQNFLYIQKRSADCVKEVNSVLQRSHKFTLEKSLY